MIALGLTPLEWDPAALQPDPSRDWSAPGQVTDLAQQIRFLMSFYEDARANNFMIRAHVPMAVARLLQHAPADSGLHGAVARSFLDDLGPHSKQAREVQQSCVQALGVMADCDADPLDAEMRAALMAVADGALADKQARHYALIALGQAAGRPGRGAGNPTAGLELGRKQNPRSFLIEKLAHTSDAEARGFCAVGLGLIGDTGAIEPITAVIAKSRYQPMLLKSAAIGLGLLGDKQIVPELLDVLERASALSSQASIASALGFIGDSRSVEPLISMLEDSSKTHLARGFAAVALGMVGDKEPQPWNTKIAVNINYRANTTTLTSPATSTGILDLL